MCVENRAFEGDVTCEVKVYGLGMPSHNARVEYIIGLCNHASLVLSMDTIMKRISLCLHACT